VQPDVSIVIVTWNVCNLACACLDSIRTTRGSLEVEVIVVDNASQDRTVALITRAFAEVTLIVNESNQGFARATNQGLARARGRNLMLLNPDTVLTPGALQKMVEHAQRHPEAGTIGPRLESADGELQAVCARRFPRLHDWFAHAVFLDRVFPRSRLFSGLHMGWWDHGEGRTVEALSGACLLVPAHAFALIGLLDDSHPMYLEDIDYCRRSLMAGFTNHYLADATVIHHEARSSKQVKPEAGVLGAQAHALFFARYSGPAVRLLFRPAVFLSELVRLPVFSFALLLGVSEGRVDTGSLAREWRLLLWSLGVSRRVRLIADDGGADAAAA
jgi:GT2 family glycosyltransferase